MMLTIEVERKERHIDKGLATNQKYDLVRGCMLLNFKVMHIAFNLRNTSFIINAHLPTMKDNLH
jgi:hypothetical protein